MLPMIIKGLFRRYERWNPVHPTVGAFWGMGIGLGCGVGWGPGFGPEVIGYVGAGCGVGFSVGITLAGLGIGLPANALIEIPYNAFAMTSSSAVNALDFARSTALSTVKSVAGESWNYVVPQVTLLSKEACDGFSSFKSNFPLGQGVELTEIGKTISRHIQSALKCFDAFRNRQTAPGRAVVLIFLQLGMLWKLCINFEILLSCFQLQKYRRAKEVEPTF
uniref:Cadmium-induced protein AS8 n=2 Tax=Anthurium amnicola TaxID=1678845 RepID=A0A1D1YTI1_9ARAE